MELTLLVVIGGFAAAAGLWLLAAAVGMFGVLLAAKTTLKPLSEKEAAALLEQVLAVGTVDLEWLAEKGFQPYGAYRFTGYSILPSLVAWQRPEDGTFFCQYLFFDDRVEPAFLTFFGGDLLMTSTMKNEQALPLPPGNWTQTFTPRNAGALLRKHEAAVTFVSEHLTRRHPDGRTRLEDALPAAVLRQVAYVRTLSLWPLQVPYWFLVLPAARHDKPLWELPEIKAATGGAVPVTTPEPAEEFPWDPAGAFAGTEPGSEEDVGRSEDESFFQEAEALGGRESR